MKSRLYYASIADKRLKAEEEHLSKFHASIFDVIPEIITLWYCIMALIAPKPRHMITKEETLQYQEVK